MEIKNSYNRREFIRMAGIAGAAALISPNLAFFEAAKKRRLPIGATGILWGNNIEPAVKDIAALGYHGFETFGPTIEDWEKNRGGFLPLLQKYGGLPLISAFCSADVLDPAKTQQGIANLQRWCKLVKASGGKVIEYCADGGRRNFDYKVHKKNMVDSMNAYAKAITDEGLVCALHPHTGTPVETQEEIDFVLQNTDTRYMKFGPDIGQIQKGGGDALKVCKDYVSLIEHMHFKDFAGSDKLQNGYLGYCPLGQGQVKLKEILDLLEKKKKKGMAGMVMFELDSLGRSAPMPAFEAAKISRDYCASLGYKFEKKTV